MILPRRQFLIGAAALIAAPAIVRVSSLMPVSNAHLAPLGITIAGPNELDRWANIYGLIRQPSPFLETDAKLRERLIALITRTQLLGDPS